MELSIFVCLASLAGLVWLIRMDRVSLGLPIAYLFALLLIHVPGAYAHLVGSDVLMDTEYTESGIAFTAVGAVCFVVGVWLARSGAPVAPAPRNFPNHLRFWIFCVIAGWLFTYGLSQFGRIPTIGAIIEKAGAIWMLGCMLGLRAAMQRADVRWIAVWLGALAVYPALMLVLGGFLSYGSTATIIVLSVLAVSIRRSIPVAAGLVVVAVLAFNLFLNYFAHRDDIREAVWGGASLEERVDTTLDIVREFEWFNPEDQDDLRALDGRLNQNYFVGLAAARIENGEVDYLYGDSLWQGLISLVPRIIWPNKPVYGGSPEIVAQMTGLELSEESSFGVGNVMEFQINYGIPGVIAGFLVLGYLIGRLDREAATAAGEGDLGRVFIYFLPAVALIQPNGSLVELVSGSAAAVAGGYAWKRVWERWYAGGTAAASLQPEVVRRSA